MTQAEQYARWVLDTENSRRTGRLIKLAAKRFLNDLERDDIYFDEEEAVKITVFAEKYCRLWEDKWRGKPMVVLPWMAFFLQQLFGWFYTETKLRRFQKAFVEISKKNAKTTLGAIINAYHLYADGRVETPKIFVGANNEDQAKICVNITGKVIEQSPELYSYVIDGEVDLFRYKENIVSIVHHPRDGFVKALSKEASDSTSAQAGGKHGINPSLGLIDEYAMADTDALLETLESAQAARTEPLIVVITTSGFKKEGPCFQKLRKPGIEILEGVLENDSYLVLIYEIDKPKDENGKTLPITIEWLEENEDCWEQSNPSIDVSVQRSFLRGRLRTAKQEGSSKAVNVFTLNFNEWMENPEVWMPMDKWNKNTHGYNELSLAGRICYAGIEIVSGLSLNALCLFFPEIDGINHAVYPLFWMPSDAMKDKNAVSDMQRWAEEGLIELCMGNVVENTYVVDKIMNLFALYNIDSLAMATTHLKHDIIQALVLKGVKCNPISWGPNEISTPTAMLEELITKGQIEHFNNPVLAWSNLNTMAVKDKRGLLRVEKQGGRTAGICAMINALAQWQSVKALNLDDEKIESW